MKKDTGLTRTSIDIELEIAELCLRQLQTSIANHDEKMYDEAAKMLSAHVRIARQSLHEYLIPEEEQDSEETDAPLVSDNGFTPSPYDRINIIAGQQYDS